VNFGTALGAPGQIPGQTAKPEPARGVQQQPSTREHRAHHDQAFGELRHLETLPWIATPFKQRAAPRAVLGVRAALRLRPAPAHYKSRPEVTS